MNENIKMTEENLKKMLREFRKQADQVSDSSEDAPLRRDLQRQINELINQIQVKREQFEPTYFNVKAPRFDEMYELKDLITINKTHQTETPHDRNPTIDYMFELFRKKAIEMAKERGYDAVFCNENTQPSMTGRGIDYRVRIIKELPDRKRLVELKMSGVGEFYVKRK